MMYCAGIMAPIPETRWKGNKEGCNCWPIYQSFTFTSFITLSTFTIIYCQLYCDSFEAYGFSILFYSQSNHIKKAYTYHIV